jgi:putative transposase
MTNYRRADIKGGTYFFTLVTYRRQRILCDKKVMLALRNGIRDVQARYPFEINGWVLLPDHLHCIWTLPPGDADFSMRWAMIKRAVSKQCGQDLLREEWINKSKQQRRESTIWQRRFWEHKIRNEDDYEKHLDYLHYNPVKHGYVKNVVDWPYSTYHRYLHQGIYDDDWAGEGIERIDNEFGE